MVGEDSTCEAPGGGGRRQGRSVRVKPHQVKQPLRQVAGRQCSSRTQQQPHRCTPGVHLNRKVRLTRQNVTTRRPHSRSITQRDLHSKRPHFEISRPRSTRTLTRKGLITARPYPTRQRHHDSERQARKCVVPRVFPNTPEDRSHRGATISYLLNLKLKWRTSISLNCSFNANL